MGDLKMGSEIEELHEQGLQFELDYDLGKLQFVDMLQPLLQYVEPKVRLMRLALCMTNTL